MGVETSDDAAVYQINETQAIVATTDFFMPIVDDPLTLAASPRPTRFPMSTRWGGRRCSRWRWSACPSTPCRSRRSRKSSMAASRLQEAGIPIAGGHTIDSVEPIYGLVAIGLVIRAS